MEDRERGFTLYKKGMKYKDIADTLGVSLNTVKSWAVRYWKPGEVATKSCNRKRKKVATKEQRPPGAPKGNLNAKGNGESKIGNQNAVRHGGYREVYLDALDDDEQKMIELEPETEEQLLIDQIHICSVRERRLLHAIKNCKEAAKGGMLVTRATSSKHQRVFDRGKSQEDRDKADEDKELYYQKISDEVLAGKRMPGKDVSMYTETENVDSVILRLEAELSRVQTVKTKAITALATYHTAQARLEMDRMKQDEEYEDLSETDGEIYGDQ